MINRVGCEVSGIAEPASVYTYVDTLPQPTTNFYHTIK